MYKAFWFWVYCFPKGNTKLCLFEPLSWAPKGKIKLERFFNSFLTYIHGFGCIRSIPQQRIESEDQSPVIFCWCWFFFVLQSHWHTCWFQQVSSFQGAQIIRDGHAPMYIEVYISMICLSCNPSIWMISSTSKHVEIQSYPGLFPLVTVANIGLAWDLVLNEWYHLGGNWKSGRKRASQDVPHFFPELFQSFFVHHIFWESHISNWQVYHSHTSRTTSIAAEPAIVYEQTHNILNSALKKRVAWNCKWNEFNK